MDPSLVATVIFALSLAVIFSEKIERTIVAMAGAVVMVGAGIVLGFYDEQQAIAAIDFATLGLLLGMMILVSLLQPTGFFEYVAIMAGRWSRGNPVHLLVLLGSVTTILSMFLDNVTTVVLIAPVAILISEIVGISPRPLLISLALLSNTGGAGTLVGDPPNVIIGLEAGLTFNQFLTNALPIVAVSWVITLGLLLLLFRDDLQPHPAGEDAVRRLNPARTLDDPGTTYRVLLVLGAAIVFFFVHHRLHLSPAYIASAAAVVALVWTQPEIAETLERIEWSVLIFFASLFVLVGGLEQSGVLHAIAGTLFRATDFHPVWLGIALIWSVAILSAIVDNIPITIALIPIIHDLGALGVNIQPLWWALVFGAGFGGNGTIIGSSANIVVVSLSRRTKEPITAAMWSRRGLPVMVATCFTASVLFLILYPYLSR